ncbi:MAG: hypothetical protein HC877_07250 [Thioploca sp.]|nr:hypothetical protein [Thioploca sp.]
MTTELYPVTVTLPAHLKNQSPLEVIIRPLDDMERKLFDPKEFKGQLQLHLRIEEIATLYQERREEMRSLLLPHCDDSDDWRRKLEQHGIEVVMPSRRN